MGLICTEPLDHDGDHIAKAGETICGTWPNNLKHPWCYSRLASARVMAAYVGEGEPSIDAAEAAGREEARTGAGWQRQPSEALDYVALEAREEEKNKPRIVWGYSDRDSDSWTGVCDSREEAIDEARGTYGDDQTVYVLEGHYPTPEEYMPDADDIIESMSRNADDAAGEFAEDFPSVSDEAKAELNALLKAWARKHVEVKFWVGTGDAEEIEPEEDLDAGTA